MLPLTPVTAWCFSSSTRCTYSFGVDMAVVPPGSRLRDASEARGAATASGGCPWRSATGSGHQREFR